MSILDRSALDESPLADLHAIASELSIDGYRRLRRQELINAILERQGPESADAQKPEGADKQEREPAGTEEIQAGDDDQARDEDQAGARRRRGRRGGRGRAASREESEAGEESGPDEEARPRSETARAEAASPRTRGARREGAGRRDDGDEEAAPRTEGAGERDGAEQVVEGLVELLPNGSGFMRVHPPEPSEEDVYISAAQVKRCELVPGDRISGPLRAPRRSERFASLVRIDTINGRPAAEVADSARFDDLPVVFPDDRFRLGSEDPTIKAIEWLTPLGRGSRVLIAGAAQAGKTEALRRLAAALAGHDDASLLLALAGVRPEEVSEWADGPVEAAAAVSLGASADAQAQAVERVIDQGRRLAARSVHAIVLIDTLDGLAPNAARKALAAARKIVDGGSLTVIATASEPLGGETTVIALDASLTSTGRFPALDLSKSWTMRPERLVGDAGAEAIARARAEALDSP